MYHAERRPMVELVEFSGIKRRQILEIVTGYGTKKRPDKLNPDGILKNCGLSAADVKRLLGA